MKILNEFLEIFSRFLKVYMDNVFILNTKFNKILNLGLPEVVKKEEQTILNKELPIKKIFNLKEKLPEYYSVGSARDDCVCPKQPIIIDDGEVNDWKNYLVENTNNKRNNL